MPGHESVESDMAYYATLSPTELREQFEASQRDNDELSLRLIVVELGRRITEMTDMRAEVDKAIEQLVLKDFG